MAEIRTYFCDFTPDLPAAVTVLSATAVHIPPSGTPGTPTVVTATPLVNVTLGPLSMVGHHILDITATLSDTEKSEMRLHLWVNF